MSVDLLQRAAAVLRDPLLCNFPGHWARAVAEMLEAASRAWPLDHTEPPRNPKDREVLYAAVSLARAVLREDQ